MRKLPYIQTSVFVDDRYQFSGNQLATFWFNEANLKLTTEEMQGIAREMNYSESTFIFNSSLKQCDAKVRIFTPGRELKFAGHPTIGTAYVMKDQNIINESAIEGILELGIGPTPVKFNKDETISMIQNKPEFVDKFTDKSKIAEILGIKQEDILDEYPMQAVSTGFPFLIVPLKSLEVIKSISLDVQNQLSILESFCTQQLLVFTKETEHDDSHAHVRMFAPAVGVIEDPATGSAAGPLGAYLEHYKVIDKQKPGKVYYLEQGFEIKRPSKLHTQCLIDNNQIQNMLVSGKVRKIAVGEFYL
ncbi:MAG: PhzF family phenazine biosynthesis protein [Asgard group archaeon]|nr:PhzF family phenazine biosynthesis protein [Asgard group archaeon]